MIGTARLTLPPGSFLQATAAGEEALAALVGAHCKRARHIAICSAGRPVLRLRLAAHRKFRRSTANGRGRSPAEGGTGDVGLKRSRPRPRLFRRPLVPQERAITTLSCSIRRARARRRKPRNWRQQDSAGRRGVLQRRDLRARR